MKRVTVASFENRTGDPALDPLARTIADRIVRGLGQISSLQVVAGSGADAVVTGSYGVSGGVLRLEAQLTATGDKRLLATVGPRSAPLQGPEEAIDPLTQEIMGRAASFADPVLAPYARVLHLPNYAAYKEGMRGVGFFLRSDFRAAIPHLERAVELDPSFAWAALAAGHAHFSLGEFPEAEAQGRRLARSVEALTPYEQADLEVLQSNLQGDMAGLYRGQRRKMELVPVAFRLFYVAQAALLLNRPHETIQWLLATDPTSAGLRDIPDYWEILTAARHGLGEHDDELADARRARRQLPDRLLTLHCEARALAALGRVDDVAARLREGAARPPDPQWTPGAFMEKAAAELLAHGYPDASRAALDQAVAWYHGRLTSEAATEATRYGEARVQYLAGRWDEARALFEGLHQQVPESVDYTGYLGLIAARQGRLDDARRIASELRHLDRPYLFGRQTLWRARLLAVLGDRAALGLLRDALSQGRGFGTWLHVDVDFESLRNEPAFRELLEPKG